MQVEFVETIPHADAVHDGCLYISLKYNMTAHRCPSGCGQLVPLPISPADWLLTYDGESASLNPSIGNGLLECRSHYFITNGQIVWASPMSFDQARQQLNGERELLRQRVTDRAMEERRKPSWTDQFLHWLKTMVGL